MEALIIAALALFAGAIIGAILTGLWVANNIPDDVFKTEDDE